MADVTGTVHRSFGGKDLRLRLTWAGLATLQEKYGNDIGGLLNDDMEGVPPFRLMIDVVSLSLQKGEGMEPEVADDLADDLITEDNGLVPALLAAAFPDVKEPQKGNRKAPRAKA
ncbi:hypothetical protein DL1_11950 [Thioclava dalianensis]|uniref:Uncharacterized protein n=1 Tax=Thioclava dalianensis TaxID=1185766 RepID=A0A074TE38_9RHOB|nr:GTA-gp10 family protein [Thioclava dalianensis]KEP68435.1 hypothetical protein DL1_11950 [Thioclava dalianensis]SFN62707.1 Phage tail tube protein, GTA-gp10 [Thioclava dalianensis]